MISAGKRCRKRCCKRVNCQCYEAKSGRAVNDLTYQQYEPKLSGESWDNSRIFPVRVLKFLSRMIRRSRGPH